MNPATAGANHHATNSPQNRPVDHDAILNIIRLAHAQSHKLAEQWIPLTNEEFDIEDGGGNASANLKDSFPFRPEQAGLGADISQAAVSDWRGVSIGNTGGAELEKLRRQMLGRKALSRASDKQPGKYQGDDSSNKKRKPLQPTNASDDDDEDEGGRAAAFTSKRAKPVLPKSSAEQGSRNVRAAEDDAEKVDADDVSSDSEDGAQLTNSMVSSSKRQPSFLDQVLTERSKKKKKKKRKNKQHQQQTGQV